MQSRNNNAARQLSAFTLVELIIVMVLITTLLALVTPSLSRSFKQRNLDQEATRLVSLTEYGRQEALSQGVPVLVWLDPEHGTFGVSAVDGYPDTSIHEKQFTLNEDVHFDITGAQTQTTSDGAVQVIQFDPDGTPELSTGIDEVRLVDRFNASVLVTKTTDGWGYEVTREDANAR